MSARRRTSPPVPAAARRPSPRAARRGAASLIVVMVLFFIISLVAAYTSRNLIFEQRTSGNQYRSTLAFEAADAGIEWAIARLNEARMSDDCRPLPNAAAVNAATPEPSFRERYLAIDAATGNITPVANRIAGCVFDGAGWSCDCPAAAGTEPAPVFVASGAGPYVAFWVRFRAIESSPGVVVRPGVVRVEVNSCTRLEPACLRFTRAAQSGDGLASLSAVLALRNGLGSPPNAPLVVRGNTSGAAGATLAATNLDPASGGITVLSGPAPFNSPPAPLAPVAVTLSTLPGTPVANSVVDRDRQVALAGIAPALAASTPASNGADRMFASVFGMWRTTYREQPAATVVECAGGCNASDAGGVNDAILLNPGHVIYVKGDGPLRIDADVGTAASPVVIVTEEGSVAFGGAPQTVNGLIYSGADTWTVDNAGTVNGGIVAEKDLHITGNLNLVYDAAVMNRLRRTTGSFVKVPGGWRDFAP